MRGGANLDATYWVYDEGINPVLQFDTGGSNGVGGVSHRYIWSDYVDDLLSDEQISFPSNSVNTLWPLADHLGSIRDIADFNESTGITAIANHRTYDSFGKLRQETGTADIQFGYTGKLYEKRTGLQNNLNRWYDPNLGKWISQDPIGFSAGDANLYRYVGNKPTNATDPSGLAETWWEWFFPPYTPPGTRQFGSHGIHLEDSYSNNAPQIEGMMPRPIPTQVCHGMSGLGRVGPCNSFRFSDPGKIEQYIVFQDHMANMAMMASSQIGLIRSGMVAPVKTGLPVLPSGYHYRTVGGRSVVARNPGRAGDLPQMHLDANVLKSGPVPRSTGGYWDWVNVRQRLGSSGWAESGQDVHHWMIPRNGWGKNVPDVVKNQKWNLMRMPSRSEHFRVHGWSFDGQPGYNLPTRLWRGTPTPAKLKIGGGIVVVGAGYYYFSE
jgi:RHS repeat-associated protein